MLFNSLQFLVFFPIVVILYYLIPHKFRYIWILLASYYFYMCWNPVYALLLAGSTIITYLSGLLIETARKQNSEGSPTTRWCKIWVAISFILNLSLLFFYKYAEFFLRSLLSTLQILFPQEPLQYPGIQILSPEEIQKWSFQ